MFYKLQKNLDCGSPKSINNGDYKILMSESVTKGDDVMNYVQKVNYTCGEGFAIAPWSQSVLTCEGDVDSFTPPDCVICNLIVILQNNQVL